MEKFKIGDVVYFWADDHRTQICEGTVKETICSKHGSTLIVHSYLTDERTNFENDVFKNKKELIQSRIENLNETISLYKRTIVKNEEEIKHLESYAKEFE